MHQWVFSAGPGSSLWFWNNRVQCLSASIPCKCSLIYNILCSWTWPYDTATNRSCVLIGVSPIKKNVQLGFSINLYPISVTIITHESQLLVCGLVHSLFPLNISCWQVRWTRVIISPRESRLCGRGLVLSYFHWIYLVGRLYEFRPVHMCCLWIPWFVQVSLCPSILPRDTMKGVMKFPHLLSSPCLIGQTNSVKIHNLMTSDRLIIEDQYLLLRGNGYFVLRRFVYETCFLSLRITVLHCQKGL